MSRPRRYHSNTSDSSKNKPTYTPSSDNQSNNSSSSNILDPNDPTVGTTNVGTTNESERRSRRGRGDPTENLKKRTGKNQNRSSYNQSESNTTNQDQSGLLILLGIGIIGAIIYASRK